MTTPHPIAALRAAETAAAVAKLEVDSFMQKNRKPVDALVANAFESSEDRHAVARFLMLRADAVAAVLGPFLTRRDILTELLDGDPGRADAAPGLVVARLNALQTAVDRAGFRPAVDMLEALRPAVLDTIADRNRLLAALRGLIVPLVSGKDVPADARAKALDAIAGRG